MKYIEENNILRRKNMILKELKIDTWIGDSTNCYILFDEQSNETIVIDPAGDVDRIAEMIDILKRKIKIHLFNSLSSETI